MKKSNLLHVMMLGTCLTMSLITNHADAETNGSALNPALMQPLPVIPAPVVATPVIITAPGIPVTKPVASPPIAAQPALGVPLVADVSLTLSPTHACAPGEMIANPYTSPSTGKCECPTLSVKLIPNGNGTSAAYCYAAPSIPATTPPAPPTIPPATTPPTTGVCFATAPTSPACAALPTCSLNQVSINSSTNQKYCKCELPLQIDGYGMPGTTGKCVKVYPTTGGTGTTSPATPPVPPPTCVLPYQLINNSCQLPLGDDTINPPPPPPPPAPNCPTIETLNCSVKKDPYYGTQSISCSNAHIDNVSLPYMVNYTDAQIKAALQARLAQGFRLNSSFPSACCSKTPKRVYMNYGGFTEYNDNTSTSCSGAMH